MKGTFAKRGLQSLLAMFFLVGGLFIMTAGRVEAQSTLSTPATQTWKSSSAALDALTIAITNQHTIMSNNAVGTPNYNDALAHAIYYKQIALLVADGVPVGNAVMQARSGLSSAGRLDDEYQGIHFTKQLLNTLLQHATALLT